MLKKGLSYIQYKRVVKQLTKAQDQLKHAVDTMVICTDLAPNRKDLLRVKLNVIKQRVEALENQIGN